jgi:hypothetical protein
MTAPPARLDAARLRALADPALEAELRTFADAHGADALPALTALAAEGGALRRAARRALYRLGQRGIAPAPAPVKPVFERLAARAAPGSRASTAAARAPSGCSSRAAAGTSCSAR